MHNQLMIEKYKAKRFFIMYLAAAVLAAAGFFLGLLKLPENLDYHASRSRTVGSAGIGLYICKQFVEAMGGGVSASVGDDMLTITVTLGIDDVNV